jgi:hypothetical protein
LRLSGKEGTALVCARQHSLFYPLKLGDEVNFRLTYDGPLKAASQSDTRRVEKHTMREVFSRQLRQLYFEREGFWEKEFAAVATEGTKFGIPRGKYLCLALVREKLHLVCDLDILFLRRDNPGNLISQGGDLDNRIKVLFDALRMPQDDNEVRGLDPESSCILLCLTEDDKLITGFRVTTDRLLEPALSEAEENDVRLIINVEVKVTRLTEENMAYFSHF